MIVTLCLKLEKRSSQRRWKHFDTALLGKMEMRLEYVEALRKSFNDRTKEGSVEERWSELKEALMGLAEEHLRRRRVARKKWISDDTLELVELKCMAFRRWQEHRLNVEKRKEYRALCKRVQQALRVDKEKWIEEKNEGNGGRYQAP